MLQFGAVWFGFNFFLTLKSEEAAGFVNASIYFFLLNIHPGKGTMLLPFFSYLDFPRQAGNLNNFYKLRADCLDSIGPEL